MKLAIVTVAVLTMTSSLVFAAAHSVIPMIEAMDQDVSNGVVSARMVHADTNGWMVVHRTDADKKPGPVVGYAPLRMGQNIDVAAILQDSVAPGDMLMLMVHAEVGGTATGVFEYYTGCERRWPNPFGWQSGDDRHHGQIESLVSHEYLARITSEDTGPVHVLRCWITTL